MRPLIASLALAAFVNGSAAAQPPDPGREAFRAIFEEMVEIDSSLSGSCTRVVRAAESRLRAAGFSAQDAVVVIPEGKPEDGNIVAVIRAAPGAAKKGVLLLAHIDVVEARREDWQRDPYTLFEENGFFYGRGTADDKNMAAIFLDLMIRLKREGLRPSRDLKMALTCGEETGTRVNGVDYLLQNRRSLIDADFALNEGAGGLLSQDGRPLVLQVQAGEKIHQGMVLEVTNEGGHSSRPVPENAIYRLTDALKKVQAYSFPYEVTPVTREYFRVAGPLLGGQLGRAMSAVAANPNDGRALAAVAADPNGNAALRTTCVATQLDAGHAVNALPQRARATLSCRIMQGTTPQQVRDRLAAVIGDPQVSVTILNPRTGSAAPQLTEEVMGPIRAAGQRMWPGVALSPIMLAGATDGRFLMNAGIPTYGVSGTFALGGESNAHGLNEKIRVKSLYESRDFLEAIVRDYVK